MANSHFECGSIFDLINLNEPTKTQIQGWFLTSVKLTPYTVAPSSAVFPARTVLAVPFRSVLITD